MIRLALAHHDVQIQLLVSELQWIEILTTWSNIQNILPLHRDKTFGYTLEKKFNTAAGLYIYINININININLLSFVYINGSVSLVSMKIGLVRWFLLLFLLYFRSKSSSTSTTISNMQLFVHFMQFIHQKSSTECSIKILIIQPVWNEMISWNGLRTSSFFPNWFHHPKFSR